MENMKNILTTSSSKESNQSKKGNLLRATSDNLTEVISQRSNLKKWNVVIINGLKYHFNWKDKFIIDKNAQKSAELQGKEYKYEEVVNIFELKLKLLKWKKYAPKNTSEKKQLGKLKKKEIERRIWLATTLEKYGVEVRDFWTFEWDLWEIKRTKELKSKLDQLKWKKYAPRTIGNVQDLEKMEKKEIERRIWLATTLEKYEVEVRDFWTFEWDLWEIKRTEEIKSKIDQLKWKPYAPRYVFELKELEKMEKEEIERKIGLATTLEKYGVEVWGFYTFERNLWKIKRTEELKSKLDQLKWKKYAPRTIGNVQDLEKMEKEEIGRRIEVVTELEKLGRKKVSDFRIFRDLLKRK